MCRLLVPPKSRCSFCCPSLGLDAFLANLPLLWLALRGLPLDIRVGPFGDPRPYMSLSAAPCEGLTRAVAHMTLAMGKYKKALLQE